MKNNSEKLRNCKQMKCTFMMMRIGCKKCVECGAEPYLIEDKYCTRCWNCENDEGILRWDDNETHIEEKQLQIAKIK